MYTIGEFASLGRVSVRMLRHYDAVGLLTPARVDPHTGYRFYSEEQFLQLVRALALKDLGLTLGQVAAVVHGRVDREELAALLRERGSDLRERIRRDTERLHRVEARLRALEGDAMSLEHIDVRALPARTVAVGSARAEGFNQPQIGPVVSSLFGKVAAALQTAGLTCDGGAVSFYEAVEAPLGGDGEVRVFAGFTVPAGTPAGEGFEVVDLPAVERAAVLTHKGAMATIGGSWTVLMEAVAENGMVPQGRAYEVYTVSMPAPEEEWVTELQVGVAAA
ncbi:MerR family transcriptional regulator [Nocardiopsis algeriensis]|uniref:DNA-binding transcriptional MerR regulator n=1 Tax=Nocardiopsis algeriensis TaxID=1478215 RepID=A0A841IY87_9ACTN|nr:MerR family transcriptional regulator [Nocardiopsis algeriensis]MBB6121111.1 DNA-binding transcriptional MerR regulator [Nocardiopsis algeriensis]